MKKRITVVNQDSEKRSLLSNNIISVKTRKDFIETYIWSYGLLYGCRTWIIKEREWLEKRTYGNGEE